MAEPFIAEIRLMSCSFAPKGWALCNGQLLPINQNQALFSLLGTTYGGDGRVNFALPDLRARTPLGFSGAHTQGEVGGEASHTLNSSEMPAHQHDARARNLKGDNPAPAGRVWGLQPAARSYASAPTPGRLGGLLPQTVTNTGGSQAHQNWSPYLVLNFVIALQGIFPSQN